MIERSQFKTTREFFLGLLTNSNQLSIHLNKNPRLILEQDEAQMTLLHHINSGYRPNQLNLVHTLLPFMTKAALEVKDVKGQTPVHLATEWQLTREYPHDYRVKLLPIILKKANDEGYDFSLEDNEGLTPLAKLIASVRVEGHDDMVKYFTLYVPTSNPNKINKHGVSLLGIAVSKGGVNEAMTLLDLGADPTAHEKVYYTSDTFALLAARIHKHELQIIDVQKTIILYKDRIGSPFFNDAADLQTNVDYKKRIEDHIKNLRVLEGRMINIAQGQQPRNTR